MSLEKEVKRFKKWAEKYYPSEKRFGEWEDDYPNWKDLYESSISVINHTQFKELSHQKFDNLLYAIARDNESEYLVEELAKYPEKLLFLSHKAVNSSKKDAKWQLAKQLGSIEKEKEEAEKILTLFVKDSNEYVSRMALLALAEIKSSFTEKYAIDAWESKHEYQRIAALWSLKKINSSKLHYYLDRAYQDGRQYLVQNAAIITQA